MSSGGGGWEVVVRGGAVMGVEGVVAGLEAEIFDLGNDVDGEMLAEDLQREARIGDEVGAGGPELVHVQLVCGHEDLHHILDGCFLHHALQLLLHSKINEENQSGSMVVTVVRGRILGFYFA